MSSRVRIAVSASLQPPFSASGIELVRAESGGAERQRQRWRRILQERCRREAPAAVEAKLDQPAFRALLLALDKQADAALWSEADPGSAAAWELLEPVGNGVCADVWLGAHQAWRFGWLDPVPGESPAALAARLQAAAAMLTRIFAAPTVPLAITFAGGPDPLASQWERHLATVRARLEVKTASLYSPLFYRDGRLQTSVLLDALRQAAGAAPTLLYVPRLPRLEVENDAWCGPCRAGAELPAARVPPPASAARLNATLAALATLAS